MSRYQIQTLFLFFIAIVVSANANYVFAEKSANTLEEKKRRSQIKMTDVEKNIHDPFDDPDTKAIVMIFVSTDCPIANSFQPAIGNLAEEFQPLGISTYLIYCSPRLTKKKILQHVKNYQIAVPAIHDADQSIGRLTKATVTPEAILIDRHGDIQYRGRINNLYEGYGKKRSKATKHFLKDACNAIVDGNSVETDATKPIGCFIHYANSTGAKTTGSKTEGVKP